MIDAGDGAWHDETTQCITRQRDQLAERVRELEAWKESAMAMEREWDPNQLATMLGGQLGESQRAVIQWKVPILVQRVKRLEEAGDVLARYAEFPFITDGCIKACEEWANAKSQP